VDLKWIQTYADTSFMFIPPFTPNLCPKASYIACCGSNMFTFDARHHPQSYQMSEITSYGDVIEKSVARQSREVGAIDSDSKQCAQIPQRSKTRVFVDVPCFSWLGHSPEG
jgi:hypothetical protein